MLLIITNSYDGTTDLLIPRLPADSVFRLNCDLLESYAIEVANDHFSITDETGRHITSDRIQKLYYRKPWIDSHDSQTTSTQASRFVHEELRYLITEIVNLLLINGKIVLVEPYAERRCGKLIQLMVAKEYFATPSWWVTHNTAPRASTVPKIVKTLSGEQVLNGQVLYTTKVDTLRLNPSYPWFVQDYVNAVKDLTIVFCRGKCFAFVLDRTFVEQSPDWREFISEAQTWTPYNLPQSLLTSICNYMGHLRLHYGRLDFLMTAENEAMFCEVNPNGQYAWLDLEGRNGLLDCIVNEISANTPVHRIPYLNPIVLPSSA